MLIRDCPLPVSDSITSPSPNIAVWSPDTLAESHCGSHSPIPFSVVLGFPATGARDPDPTGTDQQAVPPPGPREPH